MDEVKEAPKKAPFEVDSDAKANWAFRQISKNKEKIEAIKKNKAEVIQADTDEYNSQIQDVQNYSEFLQSKIAEYGRSLPTGEVKVPFGHYFKGVKQEITKDDKQLTEWVVKNHPELVSKYEWNPIKKSLHFVNGKAVDQNGEVVPGVTAADVEVEKFTVKKLKGDTQND